MKSSGTIFRSTAAMFLFAMASLGTATARAQSSSLFGAPGERNALTLEDSSWFYIKVPPPREVQLYDLITIIVNEKSQLISEGDVQRRKQANLKAQLLDWIQLSGLDLKPAAQNDGDPTIQGKLQSRLQAQSDLETRDSLQFTIAATVVDIRPNGNLVVEAHRDIENNNEVWHYSLTGMVRPEDVTPANTVLSEDVAELSIHKHEKGNVRDGYRRGWLLKALDRFSPF